MRTRRTYVALLLALAAGTAITIVSCSPDSTAPAAASPKVDSPVSMQKVQDLRNKYGWIGQYHADGLAYIYAALAKGKGKPRSKADMCRIAAKALKEFHKANRKHDIPSSLVDPAIIQETCGQEQDFSPVSRTMVADFQPNRIRSDELSATAVGYIDQLIYISENSTSRAGFLDGVYSVEAQAASSLSESEAGAVSAVASIAVSSDTYWEANLSSWIALNGGSATAYSMLANEREPNGGSRTVVATMPVPLYGGWWSGAGARALGKVLAADVLSGARVVATSWFLGPIAWEAAGAAALWGSGAAGIALLF